MYNALRNNSYQYVSVNKRVMSLSPEQAMIIENMGIVSGKGLTKICP